MTFFVANIFKLKTIRSVSHPIVGYTFHSLHIHAPVRQNMLRIIAGSRSHCDPDAIYEDVHRRWSARRATIALISRTEGNLAACDREPGNRREITVTSRRVVSIARVSNRLLITTSLIVRCARFGLRGCSFFTENPIEYV